MIYQPTCRPRMPLAAAQARANARAVCTHPHKADAQATRAKGLPPHPWDLPENVQGPYKGFFHVRHEAPRYLNIFAIFGFQVSLSLRFDQMPANGRFRLPDGVIEVAPRLGLRAAIPRALRRHGPMTAVELANWAYWERTPRNHRLGARWWANASQQSATRRAIARLKRAGECKIVGRRGRRQLYASADQARGRP
jgi:hypothetical protein